MILVFQASTSGDKPIYTGQPFGCRPTAQQCGFNESHLVQVAGQTVVQALHGFLIVDVVVVKAINLQACWPVEILVDGGRTIQRAACSERHRSAGARAAGVHQGATGKGGLATHREASH